MSGFLDQIGSTVSQVGGAVGSVLGPLGDLTSLATDTNWLAKLRRASFRGAPFFVDDSNYTVGRRLAQHEFPQRDIPYSEDLGRKQRAWGFGGYLIGDDCESQAARLRTACEQAGPGTLVHPSLGSLQATCEQAHFTVKRDIGRFVGVTLDFFEAGQITQPAPSSTTDKVDGAAAGLTGAGGGMLGSLFNTTGLASFVNSSAITDVRNFAGQISALRIPGLGDQSPLLKAIDALSVGAPTLVQSVGQLSTATQNVFQQFTDTAPSAQSGFGSMLAMASSGVKQVGSLVGGLFGGGHATGPDPTGALLTPDRRAEFNNAVAWWGFIRASALVEVAYNATGLELGSADDAEAVRGQLDDAFEGALLDAADAGQDDLFIALLDTRDALLTDLDLRIAQLPALVVYKTPTSVNALTLAWRLYADASRGDELVDRTNAINPAFLPLTGRVLER